MGVTPRNRKKFQSNRVAVAETQPWVLTHGYPRQFFKHKKQSCYIFVILRIISRRNILRTVKKYTGA